MRPNKQKSIITALQVKTKAKPCPGYLLIKASAQILFNIRNFRSLARSQALNRF